MVFEIDIWGVRMNNNYATTDTEVVIGGRVLTLSGTESEEFLQKVASYINSKIAECNKSESYRRSNSEMQGVLLALNIGDDLFKAKAQITDMEELISNKEKELYNIKHELISTQIKLENTEKNMKNLESKVDEYSKKIIRLEAEKN